LYIVWFQKIFIPPPHRVIGNSEGEGVLKAKFFLKESMNLNWNFQRGRGFKPKNPPWGNMDISWNNTLDVFK